MRPTALQVGFRRLLVRTTDAGGNTADRGPYTVAVVTPSNRGPLNGGGATETATLSAGFVTTSRQAAHGVLRRAGAHPRAADERRRRSP